MGILGSAFPDDKKEAFIDRHLKPGQVLYLFCPFTSPPKEKFVVVACLGNRPSLFLINSGIHQFIATQPDLLACQVQISAAEHSFLSQDSWVACDNLIRNLEEDDIRAQIRDAATRAVGGLSRNAVRDIRRAVKIATTIPPYYQRLIRKQLKSIL